VGGLVLFALCVANKIRLEAQPEALPCSIAEVDCPESPRSFSTSRSQYCGRDRGMPNGRLYDWEGIATVEMQDPETRWAGNLLVVYLDVSSPRQADTRRTHPI